MHYIIEYINFILHINVHLAALIHQYGRWVYGAVFLIVFFECGLFFTPFLPGESMLFALGAVIATSNSQPHLVILFLACAAVLGGFFNYSLGYMLGQKYLVKLKKPVFKKHIERTEEFYDKHGTVAVLLARLVPIVRTLSPFLAGVVRMRFMAFSFYNILGGILWISAFIYVGYFFGSVPFIKQHFPWFVMTIVILSIVPIVYEYMKDLKKRRKDAKV